MKTKYTKEQQAIISAPETKVLVNASAGTGKTFTLIAAATKVINEQENSKVAVFTLTRDAAEELKNRFQILPTFLGTIHSFALNELKEMERQHLLISEIMSPEKMKRLLLASYNHFYEIRRNFKSTINDIFKYMTDRSYVPDIATATRYDRVIKHYTKMKEEQGLYDFTDAPEYLFKKIKELDYKTKYTHLFVDEVQDIDTWEFELVKWFPGEVLAIGDPKQNIYQFRNSISHVFDKLENLGYNLYVLTKNFRSYQEILDYAGALLESTRGTGGEITNSSMLNLEEEVVVLCRYNHQVKRLSPYFDNVRTVHSYKGLESENVLVVYFQPDTEENENIMFVALTRAMNRLGIDTYDNIVEMGRKIKYGF